MTTLIAVYYSGLIITNEIDSYEFVGMNESFLLNEFSTLKNLVGLVRERLSWMDEDSEVHFKCRIDIELSNGPQMKMMSLMCNKKKWTTYVGIMMKSKIHGIELVVRMIGRNDVVRFISQRLINIIKNCPVIPVVILIEVVMMSWIYRVKYGRAWWIK
jgi:hypothetical protein